jgi:hypothetical protein
MYPISHANLTLSYLSLHSPRFSSQRAPRPPSTWLACHACACLECLECEDLVNDFEHFANELLNLLVRLGELGLVSLLALIKFSETSDLLLFDFGKFGDTGGLLLFERGGHSVWTLPKLDWSKAGRETTCDLANVEILEECADILESLSFWGKVGECCSGVWAEESNACATLSI